MFGVAEGEHFAFSARADSIKSSKKKKTVGPELHFLLLLLFVAHVAIPKQPKASLPAFRSLFFSPFFFCLLVFPLSATLQREKQQERERKDEREDTHTHTHAPYTCTQYAEKRGKKKKRERTQRGRRQHLKKKKKKMYYIHTQRERKRNKQRKKKRKTLVCVGRLSLQVKDDTGVVNTELVLNLFLDDAHHRLARCGRIDIVPHFGC